MIGCQDVTVYLYKDIVMENHQAMRSLDGSSNKNAPERCPSPLYSQDCTEDDHHIPKDYQGKDLSKVKVEVISPVVGEEMYIPDELQCKEEEITTNIGTDHKMEELQQVAEVTGSVQFIVTLGRHTYRRSLNGGKSFDGNTDLLSHRRKHKWHRPFECSLCGKSFYRKSCLVVHQRSHTGEKPFSCSECGKSYRNRSGIRRHRRFHTGEKPFSCSECGKSFTQNSSLSAHKKLAHAVKCKDKDF